MSAFKNFSLYRYALPHHRNTDLLISYLEHETMKCHSCSVQYYEIWLCNIDLSSSRPDNRNANMFLIFEQKTFPILKRSSRL